MKRYTLSKKTRHMAAQEPQKRPFLTKKMLWSIALAAIMAFSIVGYIYISPRSGNLQYNGFTFRPQGNPESGIITGWTAVIGDREISFSSHPTDVLSINMSADATLLIRQAPVLFLTSDPDDVSKEAIGLIDYDFQTILEPAATALVGFTKGNTFNKPVITCANATAYEPVIYLRTADVNRISLNGSCIIAEAPSGNSLMRTRDRLLYAYYNVIP